MVYQGLYECYKIIALKLKHNEKINDTPSFKNIILVYYLIYTQIYNNYNVFFST